MYLNKKNIGYNYEKKVVAVLDNLIYFFKPISLNMGYLPINCINSIIVTRRNDND